jgi:hypothetical protein
MCYATEQLPYYHNTSFLQQIIMQQNRLGIFNNKGTLYIHQKIRNFYKHSVAQYRADRITPLNHFFTQRERTENYGHNVGYI